MANPLKGEVAFTVGGATYTLHFDIDALVALETRLCTPENPRLQGAFDIVSAMNRTKRLGLIRAALHVGLAAHHPALGEKAAGELIAGLKVAGAIEVLNEAFAAAFPSDEDDDEDDAKGAAADAPADPPAGPAGGTG